MKSNEFLQMYAKILASYNKAVTKTCQEYGLNHTCFDILIFLNNNPQYDTASQIETVRGIKKAMASVAVETLVSSGYLKRCPDETDRRIQHLKLTHKSKKVTAIGQELQDAFQDSLFSGLTAEEKNTYEQINKKIMLALQAMEG